MGFFLGGSDQAKKNTMRFAHVSFSSSGQKNTMRVAHVSFFKILNKAHLLLLRNSVFFCVFFLLRLRFKTVLCLVFFVFMCKCNIQGHWKGAASGYRFSLWRD